MKIVDKPVLPKEIFAVPASPALLAQAVRVYLANQRQGTQSALTRAQVDHTRKKYQAQKGSGNARHGDRKAPIFVGGGVAFAPKPRDYSLSMSGKMKKKALLGALALKAKEKKIVVISGMAKLTGKTKELAQFLPGGSLLIITDVLRANVYQAAKNISGVVIFPMDQLNAYLVLQAKQIYLMEEVLKKA